MAGYKNVKNKDECSYLFESFKFDTFGPIEKKNVVVCKVNYLSGLTLVYTSLFCKKCNLNNKVIQKRILAGPNEIFSFSIFNLFIFLFSIAVQ